MSIDEIKEGLKPRDLLKDVSRIGITGGEPFLRKDLLSVCQTLKDMCPNASFRLVTNGLHPDIVLERMKEIRELDPDVGIGVSIDGFLHSDGILRGNPKHYELAWQTIGLLRAEAFQIEVGGVVTSINIDEMLSFKRYCIDTQGISHSITTANFSEFFYANTDQRATIMRLAVPKNKYRLFKKICLSGHVSAFSYYFPEYLEKRTQIFPCFSGFNSFFLASNGTIYPCIQLNKPIGNIRDVSFGELWRSDRATRIRRSIVRRDCHCYTECEVQAWFKANIYPVLAFAIRESARLDVRL